MEIRVIDNAQNQECEVLVVNKFLNEQTTSDIANKYAVEEDKFEGKFDAILISCPAFDEKYDVIYRD